MMITEPDGARELCAHILESVYRFHDEELTEAEATEIREHLVACEPCLDKFDVEQAMRLLIRRCCTSEQAPDTLRVRIQATYRNVEVVTDAD